MSARWTAACALVAMAFGASAGAAAQSRVDVPPGCGSERELYDDLEHLVGQDASAALPLRLQISAADASGVHSLSLQMRDESRALQDRDCRALWKSAVVMCAVRVRPDLVVAPDEAEHRKTARREDKTQSGSPDFPSSRLPVQSLPWHGNVGIGGGGVLGLVPQLAPLLELNASLERGRFGLALALRYTATTQVRNDEGRGARLHALGGRLAFLIAPWPIARFQAGLELSRLSGEGLGSDATLSDGAWSAAPVLEAALRPLRFSHVWLELGIAGAWAVLRPRFEILDYGTVYRVPQFGGSAVLRLGWEFH